jgi:hypothetical protein
VSELRKLSEVRIPDTYRRLSEFGICVLFGDPLPCHVLPATPLE